MSQTKRELMPEVNLPPEPEQKMLIPHSRIATELRRTAHDLATVRMHIMTNENVTLGPLEAAFTRVNWLLAEVAGDFDE